MIASDSPSLGDLLAVGVGMEDPRPAVLSSATRKEAETAIAFLCQLYEVPTGDALSEYRKGGALARILKGMLSDDRSGDDEYWAAYDAVEDARHRGFKGDEAFKEATNSLQSERDPLGLVRRPISWTSVRTYYREITAFRRGLLRDGPLSALYVRPSRQQIKDMKAKCVKGSKG